MAVINPTVTKPNGDNSIIVVQWEEMANGDTGAPVKFPQHADRTIQVTGTFGAGGNLRWQGSNDESNYATLTDPQGNALDITTAKIEAVTELTLAARPNVTAGDGTTSLTVTLMARMQQPLRT